MCVSAHICVDNAPNTTIVAQQSTMDFNVCAKRMNGTESTKHATIHNNAAAGTIYSKMFWAWNKSACCSPSSRVPLYAFSAM